MGYYILGAILIIIFFLLLTKIYVIIYFDDALGVVLKIGFISIYDTRKRNLKGMDSDKKDNKQQKQTDIFKTGPKYFKTKIKIFNELFSSVLAGLKKHLIIETFDLKYTYGVGDAAATGVLYGVISSFVGIFVSFVSNNFKLKKKNVEIMPDFNNQKNKLQFRVVLNMRILFVFPLCMKFLKFIYKNKTLNEENGE